MNRLRNRLILVFLAATLAPLAATVWLSTALLEQSVDLSVNGQLSRLTDSLEQTGRELYQEQRQELTRRVQSGELQPVRYAEFGRSSWPDDVKAFAASDQSDRWILSGNDGDRLNYLVRHNGEIWSYTASLGDVKLNQLAREIGTARALVRDSTQIHDWRRGLKLAYILLAASFWLVSLGLLIYLAHRISQPIQQLTAGLTKLAGGDLKARVEPGRDDEIGRAIQAFNHMAGKLQESTDRLVYLAPARELADAGAQDGARGEEFADAHPADGGGDAGALRRGRPRLYGAGHPDRGGRDRDPGAACSRFLANSPPEPPVAPAARGRELAAAGAHRVSQDGASGGGLRMPAGGWLSARAGRPGPAQGHPHQPAGERGRSGRRRRAYPGRDHG